MEKRLVLCLLFSLVVGFIFISIYRFGNLRITEDMQFLSADAAPEGYLLIIDEVKTENCRIIINGAVITLGEDMKYVNNKYVLVSEDGNTAYAVNSAMVKRESATEFFHDGHNYDNSGLSGFGYTGNIPAGTYRIGVLFKNIEGESLKLLSDKFVKV